MKIIFCLITAVALFGCKPAEPAPRAVEVKAESPEYNVLSYSAPSTAILEAQTNEYASRRDLQIYDAERLLAGQWINARQGEDSNRLAQIQFASAVELASGKFESDSREQLQNFISAHATNGWELVGMTPDHLNSKSLLITLKHTK